MYLISQSFLLMSTAFLLMSTTFLLISILNVQPCPQMLLFCFSERLKETGNR